nr:keratin, type II cytoskeletal 1 [Oryza sativa Japonica Group]
MGQRRRAPWLGLLFLAAGALLLRLALAEEELQAATSAVATPNGGVEECEDEVVLKKGENAVRGDVDDVKRHTSLRGWGVWSGGGGGGDGGSDNAQSGDGGGGWESSGGGGGRGDVSGAGGGGGGGGGDDANGVRQFIVPGPSICSSHRCKHGGDGTGNGQRKITTTGGNHGSSGVTKPKGEP